MDIIEVFWDARPALRAMNAKVGGGDLSDDVQALFADVRAAVGAALPGAVILTRIVTHVKAPAEGLRMKRGGAPAGDLELAEVAAAIDAAVAERLRLHQEARQLASA